MTAPIPSLKSPPVWFWLLLLIAVPSTNWRTSAAVKAGGEPPVIDEQPIGRNTTEGGHATLSVLAHGTAALTYQWRKGSEALTNSTRVTGATNAVLNIDPVLRADTSNYTVVVTAGTVSITSAPVSLVVSQLIISAPVPTGTGAVIHLYGQVGDVYRVELSLNFGVSWTTNGYATNRTGHTEHFDNNVGGGFRQFRAAFERMLPVLYPLNSSNGTAGFRAYGKLNQAWRCETSSTLTNWVSLGTFTNTTGWLTFYDPRLTLPSVRFYRIAPP